MSEVITKQAKNPTACFRRIVPYRSARAAFHAILGALNITHGRILLPSYIGWSPREGSGVFDPVASLGIDYSFYDLDRHLRIDVDALQRELNRGDVRVLVVIHYFGYVDPYYEEVVRIAQNNGAFVLEDEAHALLTDMIGGRCGRLGDACIFSFHKLLPVACGGAAVLNDPCSALAKTLVADPGLEPVLCNYDLKTIGEKRRINSLALERMLSDFSPLVEPLFGPPGDGQYPQTYPVIIHNSSRNDLYQAMNAAGFGVVSLYHTLISQIPPDRFEAPTWIARHILNLPVHQDVTEDQLSAMVQELAAKLKTT